MSTPVIQLNEQHARTIINIIDIGCARGAWRGPELMTIGQLYEQIKFNLQGMQTAVHQVQQGQAVVQQGQAAVPAALDRDSDNSIEVLPATKSE